MKKTILIALLILTAIITISCKKKTSDDNEPDQDYVPDTSITVAPSQVDSKDITATPSPISEVENREGEMKSYLTGLWVPIEIGKKRPYAIIFNNIKKVKNQWGISQADIVYECLAEGGITRLLAIGQNFTGDKLGSVRSARHYFVSIADEYDAIFIHYGKTKYATSKMKKLGTDHMDGTTGIGASIYYRDKSIKAPNNAFTSPEKIQAGIEKKKFRTEYEEGYQPHFTFYDTDTDLSQGSVANKVSLRFSGSGKPYFEYNASDKLYYKFQYGDVHKDSVTDEQLTFKNLIIQFVKEWNIDKNGYQTMDLENAKGTGFYFTNGKQVAITWTKKEAESFMRYYDMSGKELTINPGKTYIALFPNNRTDDVTVTQ